MIRIYISTLMLLISLSVFAQYSKETTISILTNNSTRKWQLDKVKTMGGCINETLIIEFTSDQTADFQYCDKGQWTSHLIHWNLLPGKETNAWFIQFDKKLTFKKGDRTLDFNTNRIKLSQRTLHTKGNTLILSKIYDSDILAEHISEKFYSKN